MASHKVATETQTTTQTKIALAVAGGALLAAAAGFVISATPNRNHPPKPPGMNLGAWIPGGYVPAGYVPGGYVPGGYWPKQGNKPGYYYQGQVSSGHTAPSVRWEGRFKFGG